MLPDPSHENGQQQLMQNFYPYDQIVSQNCNS